MTAQTPQEAVEEVLAVLDEFGWCQKPESGASEKGSVQPVCAGLAFRRAIQLAGLTDVRGTAYHEAWLRFDHLVSAESGFTTPTWNDLPSTTEEDVRLMMKRAGTEETE